MRKKSFIVVGAGMGGLATALRLAHKGHGVRVFEKTELVGGRNRRVSVGGCRFDGGPTLLMMMAPFHKLFEDVDENLDDWLALARMDPGYRVFFGDGQRLESSPEQLTMARTISEAFGSGEAAGFQRLMSDLEAMYHVAIPNFVTQDFSRAKNFVTPKALSSVIRHRMMGNLAAGINRYVKDPKLRMLFSFQSMYLGLSPFEAPWVYAVLTYMEFGEGIFFPAGGLVRIGEVIAELACRRGAAIELESEVVEVRGASVQLKDGRTVKADAVIVNADLPYTYQELTEERLAPKKHSCSASVLYMDYEGELPQLLHHNVFFGSDFEGNLKDVFGNERLPADPAFYVAASCKSDRSLAPEGHLNLMTLTPCPNLDYPWSVQSEEELKGWVFGRLTREVGFDPKAVRGIKSYGPLDYREELNLSKGAAFGLSHHFLQSAFFRPPNRSRKNDKLYFVGASTVPGNGLPMVLISADLVTKRIERDLEGA